ncbi:MAG: YbjN domain-containing protein [Phenylobacterium sp.]|uniref:YbjN domain-containing protein n=1 Tax=Phenylobacterium sp. TaxID=1871053 RepID=UPI001227C22C|nr:YbjN domain-containing protein [Phenylobacterium sp.]TAJ70989.1 MAG: YbjN domain-containing protein [Phenylobacterium sp.]
MKRMLLAAVSALVLGVGAAQARPIPDAGLTVEEVLAFMKSAGFDAKIAKTDAGEPYVATQKDGVNFNIDLYDCADRRCRAVQFVASFDLKDPLPAAKANEWNLKKRYVRAYLDGSGDPIFAYDANLAPGGSYEALEDDLDVFVQFFPEILEHIGW